MYAVATGATHEFERHRGRMFGIAYRMLGSASEAEDIVQDAFLRWQKAQPHGIEQPAAWLARVVTNLCINHLGSARVQREEYPGPWLPEPVPSDQLGPLETIQLRESVSFALLHLLERLTPPERAAFVLREAFGYSHRDIANVIGVSEANARQLYSRAKVAAKSRAPGPADPAIWQDLVGKFVTAARSGDLAALESMLVADVAAWSDGGGVVRAARRPVHGAHDVARYLIGIAEKFLDGVEPEILHVNGEPVLAGVTGDRVVGAVFLQLEGERIAAVRSVLNPHKLARIALPLSHS